MTDDGGGGQTFSQILACKARNLDVLGLLSVRLSPACNCWLEVLKRKVVGTVLPAYFVARLSRTPHPTFTYVILKSDISS